MNIIKRKSDNVVIFKGDYLVLDESGCSGEGWKFDKIQTSELVLERVDDLPAEFVTGLFTYSGGLWGKTAEAAEIATCDLDTYAKQALMEVDGLSDTIVTTVIGRRDTEYLMAEKQAQAYIDAKYNGETFPYVSSWAKAKNETDKWAADNIIETANNWRDIQSDVREKRLAHKEMIRSSETIDSINETLGSWYNYINSVKIGLGVQ